MTRTNPAKRFARASRGLAALALLWGAGAAAACATPNGDAARSPARPAAEQTPSATAQAAGAPSAAQGSPRAAAQGTPAPSHRRGMTRAAAQRARVRHDENRLRHSFLADKIALQKQLLATLDDCPGASCPDPKLAAPATRACARSCVKHWADCMGPCTVSQRFCEQHCTARKRACEAACRPGTTP